MPGNCGPTAETAQVFIETDGKTALTSQMLSLAKEACGSCIQLSHCKEQQNSIARTLHSRGAVTAVVAQEVVLPSEEMHYLTQRERLGLEPHFKFNITELPGEPDLAVLLLRQWIRASPRSLQGRVSQAAILVTRAFLHSNQLEQSALTLQEATLVLQRLAKVLIRYERQDSSERTWGRRPPEQQLDMELFQSVAPAYLADAEKVKEMQQFRDLSIVIYHNADYWQRLIQAYEKSNCISLPGVISYCHKSPRDPTSLIEAHIRRSIQKKEGAYKSPHKLPDVVRKKEVTKVEQDLRTTHPYITRPMITKIFNSCSTVERAYAKIEELKSPEVAALTAAYHDKIPATALQYFLLHTIDPVQAISDYCERVKILTDQIATLGYDIAPSDVQMYAIRASIDTDTEKAVKAIYTHSLKRDFLEKCKRYESRMHVPGWVFQKVVHHYPQEQWWEIIANLNELIETGILRESFLTCALETEAADLEGFIEYAVGKKGAYITFTIEGHMEYDEVAQTALIQRAKLDLLLYGRRLQENPETHPQLPVWLRSEEMDELAVFIKRGKKASRILTGQAPIPNSILEYFGWPKNRNAKKEALSAIRASKLRARNARKTYEKASPRLGKKELNED